MFLEWAGGCSITQSPNDNNRGKHPALISAARTGGRTGLITYISHHLSVMMNDLIRVGGEIWKNIRASLMNFYKKK